VVAQQVANTVRHARVAPLRGHVPEVTDRQARALGEALKYPAGRIIIEPGELLELATQPMAAEVRSPVS
jgi:hypothetical protein